MFVFNLYENVSIGNCIKIPGAQNKYKTACNITEKILEFNSHKNAYILLKFFNTFHK